MDPLGRQHVLAEGGHVHVAEHRRVECVPAFLRSGGRVRALAVEVHVDLVDRDRVHPDQVGVGGMHHHRRGKVLEPSVAGHLDLAAAAFLRGGTHDPHSAPGVSGDRRGSEPGTEAGGGDDVVPTRVTDAGQRVVLAQHGDIGTAVAGS